jgi:hypothetical protein
MTRRSSFARHDDRSTFVGELPGERPHDERRHRPANGGKR